MLWKERGVQHGGHSAENAEMQQSAGGGRRSFDRSAIFRRGKSGPTGLIGLIGVDAHALR